MTCDKKFFWCFLLTAVFVFLCGGSTADTVASGDAVVAITHSGFVPQNLTVTQGASVTWSNNDVNAYYQASQRVKSDQTGSNDFLSPELEPGDTYSYLFNVPGNVAYHSESDPSMLGRIVVVPLVPTTTTLAAVRNVPTDSAPQTALSNASYNVYIIDKAFVPESLLVEPGASVVWINNDGSPRYSVYHRIKSDSSAVRDFPYVDSPTLGLGGIYGYTFTVPGDYNYHCDMYPDMTGSVIVSSGSRPAVNMATPTTTPLIPSASKTAKTRTVFLKDGAFNPSDIVIMRGTTVLWINNGPATYRIMSGQELHAVGAKEPAEDSAEVEFYSDRLAIGDVFSYTFELPGTYSYLEEQRPAMTGTVTVV
jgi:plastocyanin